MIRFPLVPGDRKVSWLDQCRSNWAFKPIKYVCSINKNVLNENTDPEFEFRYIDISSVDSEGKFTPSEPMTFKESPSRARRIIIDGDVLVSTVRTYLEAITYIPSLSEDMLCSTGFAVLSVRDNVNPAFLTYWIRSKYIISEIVSRSVGVSYPAINASDIGNLPFPLIDEPQQNAIASFLDRQTSRIDSLIEKKERQIALLKEKRAALISHAVTKGLDPKVKMKDSGVEWLGDIPEHWDSKRLKYLFKFISGGTPSTIDETYWVGEIPWVSAKDMKLLHIYDAQDHINERAVDESATSILPESSTLLVTRSGILRHSIPVAVNQKPMAINQDIKGLIPMKGKFTSNYFALFILGHQTQLLSEWKKEGTTVESLEMDQILNFSMIIPSDNEQQLIVNFLNCEMVRIGKLIEKVQLSIELLKEYRASLISAAVTGKIDVREEAG